MVWASDPAKHDSTRKYRSTSLEVTSCRLYVAYEFSVALAHFLAEHWRKIRAVVGLSAIFGRFRYVLDVVESGVPEILSLLREGTLAKVARPVTPRLHLDYDNAMRA